MDYVLILFMSIFASAKMSFQTAFSKKNVKNSTDALCFNIFVFMIVAAIFLPKIFGCSPAVWLYATIDAIFTVAFQLTYTMALSNGNVSLTVLIVNLGMVINILISFLFFGEPISVIRLIAIVMTVISLVICSGAKKTDSGGGKWLAATLFAMLFTSCASVVHKFFGESSYANENQAFISCLYFVATLIGIVIYTIMKKREKRSFKIDFRMIKYVTGVAICLAVYQIIYTYALARIDGTFLFPAQTGGTILLSTISGVLIFKDRFTKRQLLGALLGLISLVLINY